MIHVAELLAATPWGILHEGEELSLYGLSWRNGEDAAVFQCCSSSDPAKRVFRSSLLMTFLEAVAPTPSIIHLQQSVQVYFMAFKVIQKLSILSHSPDGFKYVAGRAFSG